MPIEFQPAIDTSGMASRVADLETAVATRVRGYSLGMVDFTFAGGLSVALGARSPIVKDVPGALVGEPFLVVPTAALPDGWIVAQATCTIAGKIDFRFYSPAIALGSSVAFTCKVIALR